MVVINKQTSPLAACAVAERGNVKRMGFSSKHFGLVRKKIKGKPEN
jgi:hypothetical protein